jgi:hypothetical protein
MIRLCQLRLCRSLSTYARDVTWKNFDRNTFDNFNQRRLIRNKTIDNDRRSSVLHQQITQLLKTSSVQQFVRTLNQTKHDEPISSTINIEQFIDILFVAYEHQFTLNHLVHRLIESTSSTNIHLSLTSFVELVFLLVLHQQKYYDQQTKTKNQTLEVFLRRLEFQFTNEHVRCLTQVDLSLLCSAMYRLHIPLCNRSLLQHISQQIIDDETNKCLSAVDKQNLIKILILSNYTRVDIAQALVNRFNRSYEDNRKEINFNSLSHEIVRMTMRIGNYCLLTRFYSSTFFVHSQQIIEFESKSSMPIYRAKDIIQLVNASIIMGYTRTIQSNYLHLIDVYDRQKQFENKPDRLVDLLAPLAMIDCFPEKLLDELFTREYLRQLTGKSIA